MKTRIWLLVLATVLAVAPAAAQVDQAVESVLQALRLPRATQEARVLGVPESDIRGVLDTAREKRVPAGVLSELFEGENEAIRQHGPIDNFGAFVQARLQDGLRGRELAAAIRAEHAARGKGKGHVKGLGDDRGAMKGQDGDREWAGKGGPETGPGRKAEVAGKSGGRGGKPGVAGRSGERGGKPDTAKTRKGGPR